MCIMHIITDANYILLCIVLKELKSSFKEKINKTMDIFFSTTQIIKTY